MKKKTQFIYTVLLSIGAITCLSGCSTIDIFDPKGPIGDSQRFVIIAASVLMAIVVIPVFIMNFWFARKYSAANKTAKYTPQWHYSKAIDYTMWAFPITIVILLAILAWTKTHSLDPYKPIASPNKPVHIEAVAMDWKWLFIYPEENIATVNHIVIPVNHPLSFKITSDTVMCSFFIPRLGSQIYAMAGMRTKLHLMADQQGIFYGHNQQFSGKHFSEMWFRTDAVSSEEYQAWVQRIRQSPEKLDLERYEKLAIRNVGHPLIYFSAVRPGLFEYILDKYRLPPGALASPAEKSVSFPPGTGLSEEKK